MKWLQRIIAPLLLLPVLLSAAAWVSFPWYAQSLIERKLQGTPFTIKISGVGLPGLSGVRFRLLEALFTPPPDPCSGKTTVYSMTLHGGKLALDVSRLIENLDLPPTKSIRPNIAATLAVTSDSLVLRTQPDQFTFIDRNPRLTLIFGGFRRNGPIPSFRPLSIAYSIKDAVVLRDNFRLAGVEYNVRLHAAEQWLQPTDTLTVLKLYSEGNPLPLGSFKALYSTKRDPLKPCMLTLEDCSLELFQWKASTDRIEFNLENSKTSFILNLEKIPLNKLPGFKSGGDRTPLALGKVSGYIPVEFSDSTIQVRNARVFAEKGTRIISYTRESKPWLSLEIGQDNDSSELLDDINATIRLKSRHKKYAGLELSDLSASMLGGTITSTPFTVNPSTGTSLLTLKLNNIDALGRMRLYGDFSGSLKGRVSGLLPISFEKKGFSIRNARLRSPGGGTITLAIPRPKGQNLKERIFAGQGMNADYFFSEPDFLFSRAFDGSTAISFTLKKLQRKTPQGELLLLYPRGKISLWHNRRNPDMASLSGFSAEFLDGNVSLGNTEYDMAKKETETTLNLSGIPLQKLLDLQGTKKIYATGTVKGSIPVRIKSDSIEIMNGGMNAEQTGQIIYSSTPEERAAANQGLRTTYEALSNFLYVQLLSTVNMAPDGKSIITIHLKGKNPDFQGGRLVEMNLNVEQNLLDLLQSLSISSGIEQIISEKAIQMKKK
ncbi:MAG: hypothetical protein HGA26_02645 [Chlorobiaceae bacterium]|nr:hypothetical protein [Chlorobiaceae bacterium]